LAILCLLFYKDGFGTSMFWESGLIDISGSHAGDDEEEDEFYLSFILLSIIF